MGIDNLGLIGVFFSIFLLRPHLAIYFRPCIGIPYLHFIYNYRPFCRWWFQIYMFFECSLLSRETIQVDRFSSNGSTPPTRQSWIFFIFLNCLQRNIHHHETTINWRLLINTFSKHLKHIQAIRTFHQKIKRGHGFHLMTPFVPLQSWFIFLDGLNTDFELIFFDIPRDVSKVTQFRFACENQHGFRNIPRVYQHNSWVHVSLPD